MEALIWVLVGGLAAAFLGGVVTLSEDNARLRRKNLHLREQVRDLQESVDQAHTTYHNHINAVVIMEMQQASDPKVKYALENIGRLLLP